MHFLLILAILLGFPVLEIFLLVKVSQLIGWWLLAWLILSGVAGWMLIQEERQAVFARLFSSLQSGQPLSFAMLDSLRTLLAGVLLIFPGVLSDFIAVILLLLPRPRGAPARPRPARAPGEEDIIEGEWQRMEDERLPSGGQASDRSHPDR